MAAERACGYLIDTAVLKHLHEYTRADGLAFRDFLVKRGLVGSSVSRVFNSISAVFNFTSSELGLDLRNPFQGIYHDRTAGVSKRLPVPVDAIRKIQRACANIVSDKPSDTFVGRANVHKACRNYAKHTQYRYRFFNQRWFNVRVWFILHTK